MKRKTALVTGLLLMTAMPSNAFDIIQNARVGEIVSMPSSVEYEGSTYSVQWDKKSVNTESEGIIYVKGESSLGDDCNLYILVTKNPSTLTEIAHTVSYSVKNLNVTAAADGDNDYASVSVYRKDETKGFDFKLYDVSEAIAVQAEKIAEGKAEFNVDLSEFGDGTYVYFITSGESIGAGEFIYLDTDSYVSSVLSASGDTLGTDLVTLYNNYEIIMGLSLEDTYNSLSEEEKKTVMKNMHATVTAMEKAVFDDIEAEIDRETAMVMYLKAADKKAFLESIQPDYSTPLGIDTATDSYYDGLSGKENAVSYITNANPQKSADLYKAFYEAVAVTAMNESTNADVYDILKDFDKVGDISILGITDSLNKLKDELDDSQRNNVLSKMAAVTTYSVPSDISSKLASEITTVTTPAGTGGTTGSGGGGRGNSTSSGGGAVYVPTKIEQESTTIKFSDIGAAQWAEKYINTLAEKKIVNGDGDKFRPNDPVTRAEFSKILVNIIGLPQSDYNLKFGDVNENDWYADYVNRLYGAGIINGVSETEFNPNGYLTREDMSVLVCRAKTYMDGSEIPERTPDFADSDDISGYAKAAVAYLQSEGVINGVGENLFMPKSVCSRAAICKVAVEFFDIK